MLYFALSFCRLVGLPRAETVEIQNPSPELPVTLLSVFTSSRHFHMPSFHRRVSMHLISHLGSFLCSSTSVQSLSLCHSNVIQRFVSFGFLHSVFFFALQVIPPRGKTSFKIIFLPTLEGNEEISLFINTSTHGVISYQASFRELYYYTVSLSLKRSHRDLVCPSLLRGILKGTCGRDSYLKVVYLAWQQCKSNCSRLLKMTVVKWYSHG